MYAGMSPNLGIFSKFLSFLNSSQILGLGHRHGYTFTFYFVHELERLIYNNLTKHRRGKVSSVLCKQWSDLITS